MNKKSIASLEATPEQLLYAKILGWGMYSGLLILFITFALYVFGIMDPYISLDKISNCWSMSVHDYLECTGIKDGWAWVGMIAYGDFVNFIGIVILCCHCADPFEKQGYRLCDYGATRSHYSQRCCQWVSFRWRALALFVILFVIFYKISSGYSYSSESISNRLILRQRDTRSMPIIFAAWVLFPSHLFSTHLT